MHLDELRSLVANSRPEDWHTIPCYGAGTATSYLYALDKSRRGDQWELYLDQHDQVFVYSRNVNLTMAAGLDLNRGDTWEDPELVPGPRSDIRGRWLDVFWCGALVDRHVFYVVDGGRGVLPNFDRGFVDTGQLDAEELGKTATASEIRVARLVHCLRGNISSLEDDDRFDYYLRRSGIIEVPDDVPT